VKCRKQRTKSRKVQEKDVDGGVPKFFSRDVVIPPITCIEITKECCIHSPESFRAITTNRNYYQIGKYDSSTFPVCAYNIHTISNTQNSLCGIFVWIARSHNLARPLMSLDNVVPALASRGSSAIALHATGGVWGAETLIRKTQTARKKRVGKEIITHTNRRCRF
jgi:hypothetical protein